MQAFLPEPQLARADLAACRALLRDGSRTFFAASFLLPRGVAAPAMALYAFCRLADDAIDRADGAGARGAALARLHQRLDRACAGRPLPLPADRALATVLARFAIPRELPASLLEGFAWDAAGRRYGTLADLRAYAVRVAGSVGMMMALIMGARGAAAAARACDLGVAMQLSNIARDVGEDARAGRLYLPLQWLCEAGIDPEAWLADPVFTPALGGVVARLLAAADALYARAGSGIGLLPPACRPGIRAAQQLYAAIGAAVAQQGCDPLARRARVPARRKAWLLARSLPAVAIRRGGDAAPGLAEARFLFDAVAAAPLPAPPAARRLEDRVVWLLALFERLAERPAMPAREL